MRVSGSLKRLGCWSARGQQVCDPCSFLSISVTHLSFLFLSFPLPNTCSSLWDCRDPLSLAGSEAEVEGVPSRVKGFGCFTHTALLTDMEPKKKKKDEKIVSSGPLAFLSRFFGLFPRSSSPYDSYWSLEGLLSETTPRNRPPFHYKDFFFFL